MAKKILLKHRLRTKRNHKYSKREDFGWDEAAGQRVLMCANRLVKQLPAFPLLLLAGRADTLSYRFVFGNSHISGDVFCASRRGTDNVTRFSPKVSCCHATWKASDLKPACARGILLRGFLAPKPGSAERFSKKQFFVLSAAVYGASFADMHQTLEERKNSWWYETDPLARPFVKLPAPAYYATGLAMATCLNLD